MSTDSTRAVFDATATTYDPDRARLIPCFKKLYETAVDLLSPDAQRILDLGAGTGLLTAFVRQRLPAAHIHLVDISEPMLAQARERFRQDHAITTQGGDYTLAPLGGPYDAVVSALSIHHLDDAAKQRLFIRLYAVLKPGGSFVNAEQILQPTPETETAARAEWLREVRTLGATEAQIEASLLRQTEDRCATIADQLLWLQDAGFPQATCPFSDGRFAVLHAIKA